MTTCTIQLLSGHITTIEIFEGYRFSQLKNELIEQKFIDITDYPDLKRIQIYDENYEQMNDSEMVSFGHHYCLFIKHKPIHLTLQFKKHFSDQGIITLYDDMNKCVVIECGYSFNSSIENKVKEKLQDVYIDQLTIDKFYKKAYSKIRHDLWLSDPYNNVWLSDDDDNKEENEDTNEYPNTDYYKMTDNEVLDLFIERFIKKYCRGIEKISHLYL
jgi:hypothetical protein